MERERKKRGVFNQLKNWAAPRFFSSHILWQVQSVIGLRLIAGWFFLPPRVCMSRNRIRCIYVRTTCFYRARRTVRSALWSSTTTSSGCSSSSKWVTLEQRRTTQQRGSKKSASQQASHKFACMSDTASIESWQASLFADNLNSCILSWKTGKVVEQGEQQQQPMKQLRWRGFGEDSNLKKKEAALDSAVTKAASVLLLLLDRQLLLSTS